MTIVGKRTIKNPIKNALYFICRGNHPYSAKAYLKMCSFELLKELTPYIHHTIVGHRQAISTKQETDTYIQITKYVKMIDSCCNN